VVVTLEVNRQDILKMFAYHSLCDSLKSNSRKIKTNQIKDGEREKGGGAKIPSKRSVLNANHGAYRRLSGLIGFGRPAEFGLYRPRHFQRSLPWPGPLGTLPSAGLGEYLRVVLVDTYCTEVWCQAMPCLAEGVYREAYYNLVASLGARINWFSGFYCVYLFGIIVFFRLAVDYLISSNQGFIYLKTATTVKRGLTVRRCVCPNG